MTKVTHTLVTVQDFFELAAIIRRHRGWHRREQYNYALHPIVIAALKVARPKDWHQLVLEWPHQSTERSDEIAYTRDEGKGNADAQTRVGAGKYLARHWPNTPSNVLRDLVAAHVMRVEGCCKFLDATVQEIVRSVQQGPVSCMQWDDDCFESTDGRHPYEVYAPELGWRAAVRLNPHGQIIGRALVHDGTHMRCHDTGKAVFVRSYRCYNDQHGTTEYSHADEKLEAWLATQKVHKRSSWPEGTPLKAIDINNHGLLLLPYLDGNNTHVTHSCGGRHYCMDDNAEDGYNCCNTDGTGDPVEDESGYTCDRCGCRVSEDDVTHVEDECLCSRCLDSSCTYIDDEWVPDQYVRSTRCGGVRWDSRGETPDDVRCLDHGRYEDAYVVEDDAVCDINGDYWHVCDVDSDDGIVQLCDHSKYEGEYVKRSDAIEVGDEWYHEDDAIDTPSWGGRTSAPRIVEATHGEHRGGYIRADEAVTCVYGVGAGIWHEGDKWETACAGEHEGPMSGMSSRTHFVVLHNASCFTEEALDVTEALWVEGEGWFHPLDTGNVIVRIMDDVYALASDLVAA